MLLSQSFGAKAVQGRELRAPIPHQTLPAMAPAVPLLPPGIKSWPSWCWTAVTPKKCSRG